MKILHLTGTFAPVGGIETYVLDLLPHLEADGHENVVVYRRDHPLTPPAGDRTVFRVPPTQPRESGRRRILEIVAEQEPAVVYLHDIYDADLVSRVAAAVPTAGYVHIFYPVCPGLGKLFHVGDDACTRAYGAGCVPMIYLRRCASARDPRQVLRIMRNTGKRLRAYRSLRRIVVASRYMKALLVQNGFAQAKVDVLPYFIPLGPETPPNEPDRDGSPPAIFFAGRLEYEKGLPYLLEALRRMETRCELFVAGDGSRRQQYVDLATRLGVADRVRFLGWLSAPEIGAWYRRCAATVMPTIMPEPFGKVGVEALANGRPVVAFAVGGIPEWLVDGRTGHLVAPLDVGQMAARLDELVREPDRAVELGAAGRRHVREHYSAESHVAGLMRVFRTAAQIA